MKKRLSFISVMLLVFIMSVTDVFAGPANTIKINGSKRQPGYVAGAYWPKKVASDGTYLYCLEHHKAVPYNQTLGYKGDLDVGYTYIILNGYPYKSFTGNGDYDYYITQGALHWYKDRVNGVSDNKKGEMTASFKTNGSDPHNLRPHMKKLLENALKARKQGYVNPSASISVNSKTMTISSDGSYFISSPMTLKTVTGMTSKIKSMKVSITSGPKGSILVDKSGKTKTNFSSGDVFYVKVPTSGLTKLKETVSIHLEGNGTISKVARYEHTSNVHGDVQDLTTAKPYESSSSFKQDVTFNLTTTEVSISKVDITTKEELPGATLVLKNSKGNIVDQWVSTKEKHVIRHLPAGTYTLTETIAPDGYVRSKDITFSVKADGTVTTVTMVDDYTKVEISKQDVTTKKELPGAKLKLYNEEGKVIAEWTSSDKTYNLEKLKVGKYKLVEEVAPEGYVLAKEAVAFEVLETGDLQKVVMYNTPLTPTPDTAFHPSTMLYIAAAILGCFGIGLVYWNGKQHA